MNYPTMNVLMEHGVINLTPDEIRILQTCAPGWEEVWNKIWVELLISRLPDALLSKKNYVPAKYRSEFIAFFIEYCKKKIEERELFDEFDVAKGDVFQWLCNRKNLYWRILEFRRQELRHKIKVSQRTDKITGETIKTEQRIVSLDEENDQGKTIADKIPRRQDQDRRISENAMDRLKELVAKIQESPLILNNKKDDTIPQHACLQLYPHIDKGNVKMQTLCVALHTTVRKANTLHTNPEETISAEHKIAEERIHLDIEKTIGDLEVMRKPGARYMARTVRDKESELESAEFERFFLPLIVEQIVQLEGVNENTASAHRSRYCKDLPNLLPPEIKSEWEDLRDNDLSD